MDTHLSWRASVYDFLLLKILEHEFFSNTTCLLLQFCQLCPKRARLRSGGESRRWAQAVLALAVQVLRSRAVRLRLNFEKFGTIQIEKCEKCQWRPTKLSLSRRVCSKIYAKHRARRHGTGAIYCCKLFFDWKLRLKLTRNDEKEELLRRISTNPKTRSVFTSQNTVKRYSTQAVSKVSVFTHVTIHYHEVKRTFWKPS